MGQNPHAVLSETRAAMEEVAAKMLSVKSEGKPELLRGLVTDMSLLLVSLRQANRTILVEEERAKAETEKARAPVDFTMLQLHNLVYEKNHYLKAIKACKDFRSRYPDIDLVADAEFLAHAPDHITAPLMSADASHDRMLKRLHYELFQRKDLCRLRERLEQRKKHLSEVIAARKKFLSSLPSHLKSLKKASLPVQHQLGMPHTKKSKQRRVAELLPPPLYILYSQLLSQKEAFQENIQLEVVGSMKDAQAYAARLSSGNTGVNMESNKIEDETPDDEDDGQRRRKRPKKIPSKDNLADAGLYQSHPLNVILHVFDNQESSNGSMKLLTVKFEYLVKLNVVCVGNDGVDEESGNKILCNLFPDDTGLQLPHQTAKLYAGDSVVFDERMSRPYKWAQHLAGMDFLPEIAPLLVSGEFSNNEMLAGPAILSGLSLYRKQNRVETILQRIRSRRKAQLALQEQLDSLANLKWPSLVYTNNPWASKNPVCLIDQWFRVKCDMENNMIPSTLSAEQALETSEVHVADIPVTLKDGVESATEDGELPSAIQAPINADEAMILTPTKVPPILEHSKSFSFISKSSASNKGKSPRAVVHSDDLECIWDGSDSDAEKQDKESEKTDIFKSNLTCFSWEKYGSQEYKLVLSRSDKNKTLKLLSTVTISVEYPLRPPCFSLSFSSVDIANSNDGLEAKFGVGWYNELRAMEAEVNLHVLNTLPLEHENEILAHQIRCLGMLFDFHFDQFLKCSEMVKSSSIIDLGLCKPITGKIIARSLRGRDRRKMLSWKSTGCAPGFPY